MQVKWIKLDLVIVSDVYRRIGIIYAFLNINNAHGISLPVRVNSIEGLFSTVGSRRDYAAKKNSNVQNNL